MKGTAMITENQLLAMGSEVANYDFEDMDEVAAKIAAENNLTETQKFRMEAYAWAMATDYWPEGLYQN